MSACCFAYSGGEPDEVLFHVCDEHAEIAEREALEFDHDNDPNRPEKAVLDPIRVQCEDCDRWVPKTDSVFLEGCARELCLDCAEGRPSEDWK